MLKRMWKIGLGSALAITLATGTVIAQDKSPEDLAKESEEKCAATASTPATPQQIVDKVNAAAQLVESEGKASFPKFKGSDSDFLFGGTYIWIHDKEGVMLMHPVKYKMEGKRLLNLKDRNGKMFFVEMTDLAMNDDAGWCDYVWPKPGEKDVSSKVSYVKKAMCDGEPVIIGCGVYDMALDDVKDVK